MYCPACGAENHEASNHCTSCGKPLPQASAATAPPYLRQAPPSTYLVRAILVTVFCCLPFGIVAIVYAAQVNPNPPKG